MPTNPRRALAVAAAAVVASGQSTATTPTSTACTGGVSTLDAIVLDCIDSRPKLLELPVPRSSTNQQFITLLAPRGTRDIYVKLQPARSIQQIDFGRWRMDMNISMTAECMPAQSSAHLKIKRDSLTDTSTPVISDVFRQVRRNTLRLPVKLSSQSQLPCDAKLGILLPHSSDGKWHLSWKSAEPCLQNSLVRNCWDEIGSSARRAAANSSEFYDPASPDPDGPQPMSAYGVLVFIGFCVALAAAAVRCGLQAYNCTTSTLTPDASEIRQLRMRNILGVAGTEMVPTRQQQQAETADVYSQLFSDGENTRRSGRGMFSGDQE